eukprot:7394043-Pyramimonas_sp.AAC.1
MSIDAGEGYGDRSTHLKRIDTLSAALYPGVEQELGGLFAFDKPEAKFISRHDGPQHRHSTAGVALARQQSAGAQQPRALRTLR